MAAFGLGKEMKKIPKLPERRNFSWIGGREEFASKRKEFFQVLEPSQWDDDETGRGGCPDSGD